MNYGKATVQRLYLSYQCLRSLAIHAPSAGVALRVQITTKGTSLVDGERLSVLSAMAGLNRQIVPVINKNIALLWTGRR